MPKHTRSSSSTHNHHDGYGNPMPMGTALAPAQPMSIGYNSRSQQLSLNPYYPTVPQPATAPAVQAQYDPYVAAVAPTPSMPHRASSGAWSPQDDKNLLQARQSGLNWAQIQSSLFPNKTPNACRKRHERLMERKGADDWDARKLEKIAQEYMSMRREIWQPLASKVGEKWNVVEARCMNSGLKNIQNSARAGSRRDRIERSEAGQSYHGYDDDSGISGIGLTPVDDLDASYSSPETSSSHSAGSSYHNGYHHHMAAAQHLASHAAYGYPASNGGLSSSGYSSSVSSTAAQAYNAVPTHSHHSQGGSPYMEHGQRLPSVDKGFGNIINHTSI